MSLRTGIMNMGQRKSQKSCSSESEVSVETYDVFYLKKIKKNPTKNPYISSFSPLKRPRNYNQRGKNKHP